MKRRISSVYRHHHSKRATTYVLNKQGRSRTKGLGAPKITTFNQGNFKLYHGQNYKLKIVLKSNSTLLLTEHSLESFRMTITRALNATFSKGNWYLLICVRPHVLLREHKKPTSGPVDRISSGMRLAYGAPFARAAKITVNQPLLHLYLINSSLTDIANVKRVLRKGLPKIAGSYDISTRCYQR